MSRKLPTLALTILIPGLLASGGCREKPAEGPAPTVAAPVPNPAPPAAAPAATSAPLVVFLGDSLTAGLGLAETEAYPARVEAGMRQAGTPIRALNAGISGDTSAGGLRRVDWLLTQHPAVVVVGLGGNDGLRGLPVDEMEQNLRQIVERCQKAGARVVLLGMKIPPNYGPDYTDRFAAVYPELARELNVPLVPFLLEGVGGIEKLNQADGIHPTAEGQKKAADNVLPALQEVLAGSPTDGTGGK